MMGKRLGVFLTVVSLLLATAGPAAAKMPPYDAEFVVDADVATVTVVFDGYDMGVPRLEGIFGLVPRDRLGEPADQSSIVWVDMMRTEAFTYAGSVVIPYPGEWAITAFPDASPPPPEELYPTLTFTAAFVQTAVASQTPVPKPIASAETLPRAAPLSQSLARPLLADPEPGPDQTMLIAAGGGVAVLAGIGALLRRRRNLAL